MAKAQHKNRTQTYLAIMLVVLLILGIWLGVHLYNVHTNQNKSGIIPTSKKTSANTSQTSSTKSQIGSTSSTSSQSTSSAGAKTPNTSSPSSSEPPEAPFGSFVSNHRPGQNGSPTTEESVCNTTPGATCDIQLTNGSGVTKDLGFEAVDSNGSAFWSWNISGANLASGSWTVTAVAKLNGISVSTADPTLLVVQ